MVDESLLEEKRARVRRRGVAIGARCARVRSVPRSRDAVARGRRDSQPINEGAEIATIRKRLGYAKPDIAIGPQTSIGLEGVILRLVIR